MQVGKMSAAVMIACIGEIKNFSFRNYPAEPVTMAMLHFFHTIPGSWMRPHQLLQCGDAITFYMQQFFINKSTYHTFFLPWITVIEYADFNRQFYQVLYNIFDGDPFVVAYQLLFVINLAKKNSLHADIGLYNKWKCKTCITDLFFHFGIRGIM